MATDEERGRGNHGLLVKWMVSYASIILLAFLFILCGYFLLSRDFRAESFRVHRAKVEHSQISIDYLLSEILTITGEIVLLPEVRSLGSFDGELGPRQYYLKHRLRDELGKLHRSHPAVESVFVYFGKHDYIVSSMGAYDVDYYFDTYYGQSGIERSEWKERLFREAYVDAFSLVQTGAGEESAPYMQFYSTQLDVNDKNYDRVSICLTVREETMMNLAGRSAGNGLFLILDRRNQVILADPGPLPVGLPDYAWLARDPSSQQIVGDEILTSFPSNFKDWIYVSLSSEAAVAARLDHLRWVLVGLLICFWIVGAVVAYSLARRNYRPVTQLLDFISGKTVKTRMRRFRRDEYCYIEETFSRLRDEKASIQDQLNLQQESVRTHFLSRFLSGRIIKASHSFEEQCDFHGLYFEEDAFLSVILRMEDTSLSEEELRRERGQQWLAKKLQAILSTQSQGYGWLCEIDGFSVALINCQMPSDDPSLVLPAILGELQQRVSEETGITYTIGASRYKGDLSSIPQAFEEAQQALDRRMIHGKGSVITYYEVLDPEAVEDSFDSLSFERKFINQFSSGNYEDCAELLNDVYDELEHFTSMRKLRVRLFGFVNLLVDVVGSFVDPLPVEQVDCETRLLSCTTVEELRRETESIFREVREHTLSRQTSSLHSRVLAIIEASYADPSLSVGRIAEQLDLSISNFSWLYKAETGNGPLDSIHGMRISKAKLLLSGSDAIIKEVAAACGYLSDITFIRVFKKYEGITPGQYRNQVRTIDVNLTG